MIDKTSLKQRLVLFSVEAYLDDISVETTYNYPAMLELKSAISAYIITHRFSKEEHKLVLALADTDVMKAMTDTEVDRNLFSIELLYLYVTKIPKKDRAHLNISDKRLTSLKSTLIVDMLKLKHDNPDSHLRVKSILDDTRVAAKRYYSHIEVFIDESK